MNIHFSQPIWLIAGAITCLLLIVYLRMAAQEKNRILARFAAPKMCRQLTANVSPVRRRAKEALLPLAVLVCFLSLAGPQYGEHWVEVKQKGIDILFGIDASRSMLARDIQPDRLQRAKLAIKDFVALLNGDRVGLMPFAGTSFLMCPLTTDYAAFNASLDAITPASIPLGGTDLAGAIKKADKILINEANHKILILVTDGENLQGKEIRAAEEANKQEVTIYCVGVGTKAGDLIPDSKNGSGFIKDKAGNFVRSSLDEQTLKKISGTTGGIYTPLGNLGQGFTTIYNQKLKLIPKEEHQERKQRQPIERFYWILPLAIFLLAIEFLLSGRKSSWSFGVPLIKTAGRRLFNKRKLLIVFCLCAIHPPAANGSTARQLFHEGKLDQAEKKYSTALKKQPDNPTLLFNLGDIQYRKKDYKQAITSFTGTLATDDLNLQAKAYYNLGNSLYQQGKSTLKTEPEKTIDQFKKAVSAYKSCLKLTPGDPDAKENLSLIKKQLQRLEQQNKKKQQKNKQGDDKNKTKKKKDNAGRQGADKQQQDQQQQKKENSPEKKSEDKDKADNPEDKSGATKKQTGKENTKNRDPQKENSNPGTIDAGRLRNKVEKNRNRPMKKWAWKMPNDARPAR